MPWDQALARRLKRHELAQARSGNVVLVAPVRQVMDPRQKWRRDQQAESQAEPTVTLVVPVNYRDATELSAILEHHLGPCATVSADARTNTVIITGTPSCLRFSQKPAP